MPDRPPIAPPRRTQIALAFASVYVIWGSTYLAIRYGIETIPPLLMAGARFLTAGGALYGWSRARGGARPTLVHWRSALAIGGLMLLIGNGCVTWSEQRVPSGVAALLVACVPLWMVLLEWKRPSRRTVVGLLLGIIGIALLVGPEKLAGGERVDLVGALALVVGSCAWAMGSLYSRKAPLPESRLLATAMEMLCGGALLTVGGLVAGEASGFDPLSVSGRSLLALLYLIAFGSLVGFTSYVWLLRMTTPARAATYAYVNPIVAILLGWLIAGEAVSGRMLAAAVVIVGAVAMILSPSARPEALVAAPSPRLSPGIPGSADAERL